MSEPTSAPASVPLLELVRDTAWLSGVLGTEVREATEPEIIAGAGGLISGLARVVANASSDSPVSLVLKVLPSDKYGTSKSLGLTREAFFFRDLAPSLHLAALPRVYWARGDLESGAKELLMEDLGACVQCGYVFGPGSPHNWGKDLAAKVAAVEGLTAEHATRLAFRAAARLHARNWGSTAEIMQHRAWLRGADWLVGEARPSWEEGQATVRRTWATLGPILLGGAGDAVEHNGVRWAASLVRTVDASLARTSWESFQAWQRDCKTLTLVHGDFHPANAMVRPRPGGELQESDIILLDWENVGVGSGPQDLAQWVISHMAPDARRACERQVVQDYAEVLAAELPPGAAPPAFDDLWQEYVRGGSERWIWLLVLLATMVPAPAMQFFHDQVAAFCADHGVNAETVGQPRL